VLRQLPVRAHVAPENIAADDDLHFRAPAETAKAAE
jgi:hypothetical protein